MTVVSQLAADQADGSSNATIVDDIVQLDQKLADRIGSGELLAVFKNLEKAEEEELQYAMKASFDTIPDIDIAAMQALLVTSERGLIVRHRSLMAMEKWNQKNNSAAVAANIQLEKFILIGINARTILLKEILDRIT